ncbi:hypothetical protein [Streptomyces hygroscopicus]
MGPDPGDPHHPQQLQPLGGLAARAGGVDDQPLGVFRAQQGLRLRDELG